MRCLPQDRSSLLHSALQVNTPCIQRRAQVGDRDRGASLWIQAMPDLDKLSILLHSDVQCAAALPMPWVALPSSRRKLAGSLLSQSSRGMGGFRVTVEKMEDQATTHPTSYFYFYFYPLALHVSLVSPKQVKQVLGAGSRGPG